MRRSDLVSLLSTVPPFPSPSYELEQYKTSSETAADIVSSIQAKYGGVEGKLVCDLGCGTGILGMGASALGAAFVLGVDIDAEALECARGSAEECGVGESMDFVLADVSTFEGGVGVVGPFPLDSVVATAAAGASSKASGGGRGPVVLEGEGEVEGGLPPLSATASAMRSSLATWQGRFDTVIMNPPFGTRAPGVDVLFLRAALALVHKEGHVFSLHKSSTRAHLLKSAQSWGVGGEAVAQLKEQGEQVRPLSPLRGLGLVS